MSFRTRVENHLQASGQVVPPDADRETRAVLGWVARVRPDLSSVATDEGFGLTNPQAPADAMHGAVLYAARLISRRGTPVGAAPGYDGAGGLIASADPDVERLLGIGKYRKPTNQIG